MKKLKKNAAKPVSKKIKTVKRNRMINPVIKDEAITDAFPGYPHYEPGQDIMNPKNRVVKKVFDENLNKITESGTKNRIKQGMGDEMEKPIAILAEEVFEFAAASETDLNKDEKNFLESDELSEDMGEDEVLRSRVWNVDMSAGDLDIPRAEEDDETDLAGEEDEENNHYSIGGDRHEDMEQEHDPGR